MTRIIVNADDFGMNENCTMAIADCMSKGWVTNTSLMVNMPYCEEAVALARTKGLLDRIGLHLNLTEGFPMTDAMRKCREFCDADGCFTGSFRHGLAKIWTPLSRSAKLALESEVEAQAKKYLALGLPVLHFDAHHHSHLVPRVTATIFRVMALHGFKSVRGPDNLQTSTKLKSRIYYPIENAFALHNINRFGFVTTDFMGPLAEIAQRGDWREGNSTLDFMVHPMYLKDGKLDMSGDMSDSGLRPMTDTNAFLDSVGIPIKKISYRELQNHPKE